MILTQRCCSVVPVLTVVSMSVAILAGCGGSSSPDAELAWIQEVNQTCEKYERDSEQYDALDSENATLDDLRLRMSGYANLGRIQIQEIRRVTIPADKRGQMDQVEAIYSAALGLAERMVEIIDEGEIDHLVSYAESMGPKLEEGQAEAQQLVEELGLSETCAEG